MEKQITRRKSDRIAAIEVIRQNGERWPSTFVARSQVPQFTGGLVAVGTIANMDSGGKGPRGSFRLGRQIAYPTAALVEWLIGRLAA